MARVESDEEDLTRKERREAARAQRKAAEEAELARAKRRTRMTQLGIVVAIVVVAIVVIAITASGGGKSNHAVTNKTEANANVATVNSELKGTTQSGNVLGSPKAPVTLVYFGDLECPICREFTLGALPTLIKKYVATGKLRIEYKSLETATREPEEFKRQQVAALAAGKQNLMWNYLELFYHEQGQEDTEYATEGYLQNLAQQVPGLNMSVWAEDRKNPEYENQLTTEAQLASNEGFNGTPSFLIGRTGGKLDKLGEVSLTEPSGFEAAIESKLKG